LISNEFLFLNLIYQNFENLFEEKDIKFEFSCKFIYYNCRQSAEEVLEVMRRKK